MSWARMNDAISGVFERSGVSYSEMQIDEDFMHVLTTIEGKRFGSPEFDPSLHDFSQGDGFWIGCRDQSGDLIGTLATRRLNANTFTDACRSYRLWYGEKIRFTEPLDVVCNQYERIPAGCAAFSGAGWVRQDWRGRGLSWAMTRVGYLCAMRRWQPDWMIGLVVAGVAKSMIPQVDYGFPRSDLFATGYRVPGLSPQTLNLLTMTQQEAAHLIACDNAFLRARPHFLIDSNFGDLLRAQRRSMRAELTVPPVLSAAG